MFFFCLSFLQKSDRINIFLDSIAIQFGLLMSFLSLIHKCLKLQIWLATNRTTIIFIILLCAVSILMQYKAEKPMKNYLVSTAKFYCILVMLRRQTFLLSYSPMKWGKSFNKGTLWLWGCQECRECRNR